MLHNCGMSAEYEIVDICGMSNIMVCMWSVKCEVWSVKCEIWSVTDEVGSVKCEVWIGFGFKGDQQSKYEWWLWYVKNYEQGLYDEYVYARYVKYVT
jgi:hypothetical protein